MAYHRSKDSVEQLQRKYAGIIAAIARASALFKVDSYLVDYISDKTAPLTIGSKEPAITFFVIAGCESDWHSMVRYLIEYERFYTEKTSEEYFYRRGSLLKITSDRQQGNWTAGSYKIN